MATEDISGDLKAARKALKKEKKEMKKMLKRARKAKEGTPDEERGKADDEGRWDQKKKKMDDNDYLDVNFLNLYFLNQFSNFLGQEILWC